jgi:DNA-binding NtrC family response regulator
MATVLIVDDDAALRDGLAETVRDLGHVARLTASGRAALDVMASEPVDAVLLDLRMPGMDGIEVLRRVGAFANPPPVVVLTAFASAENTIEAMRLGAFDHLTKPIGRRELHALLDRMLPRPDAASPAADAADAAGAADTLIGASDAMRRVQKAIGLAAASDATVLVLGETGTGKELVARALHRHGARADKPFVAVNCAAIPTDLLESELFGHAKGAFTGATTSRAGAFRDADGGTLFLDEIGDMSGTMQAKILRALQERVVSPVGGSAAPVDVRIVAATHRDLSRATADGTFRQDLYYRLNVIPIALPPLRERRDDILSLAEHFLRLAAGPGAPKRLTPAACARLLAHAWPGNVRELRNVVERASVLVRGDVVDADDLAIDSRDGMPLSRADLVDGDMPGAVARLEKAMIVEALAACRGNRAEAARRLNIHRQLLYTKMQRYDLGGDAVSGNPTPDVGKADN